MVWLRVLLVVGLLTRAAEANLPPPQCIDEPRTAVGYMMGAFYVGLFAKPDHCAYIGHMRGFGRFPVLFLAGVLLQLDAGSGMPEHNGLFVRRARLTAAVRLWRRVTFVASGDAAEGSVPDAFLHIDLILPPAVKWESDDELGVWLEAGRRVVPYGLEAQWSDAKLPFLERTTATRELAPAQRQNGASLVVGRLRHLEVPRDTADTNRLLVWHAEVGAFQPEGDRDSYEVMGRAFVHVVRENEYNAFKLELHLGASAGFGRTPAGEQRHYALEAEARYRRVRASAELMALDEHVRDDAGQTGRLHGAGGALTLTATLRPNPYRWYTEPISRSPVREPWHVDGHESDGPNVGLELDAGIDVLRGDLATTDLATTTLRAAAHFYVEEVGKVSVTYGYTAERHEHAVLARLQYAL